MSRYRRIQWHLSYNMRYICQKGNNVRVRFSMSSSPELDALESTARHLCVVLFSKQLFSHWPTFRLAGKYFQLAAFVMLIYDHSKLVILSKPLASTQVWIFPSANVWPGGLSVIPLRLENLTLNYFLGRSHLEAEVVEYLYFIPDK